MSIIGYNCPKCGQKADVDMRGNMMAHNNALSLPCDFPEREQGDHPNSNRISEYNHSLPLGNKNRKVSKISFLGNKIPTTVNDEVRLRVRMEHYELTANNYLVETRKLVEQIYDMSHRDDSLLSGESFVLIWDNLKNLGRFQAEFLFSPKISNDATLVYNRINKNQIKLISTEDNIKVIQYMDFDYPLARLVWTAMKLRQ